MSQQIEQQQLVSVIKEKKQLKLCQCGCGKPVSKEGNRFVCGHNNSRLLTRKTRVKTTQGYWKVICKEHPRADTYGYVLEHILVFEDTHNCCMLNWGVVHHRDRNPSNNVWYNLKGMMNWQHLRLHNLKDMDNRKCSRCGSSKTYLHKLKGGLRPFWHIDKQTKLFLCNTCTSKQYIRDHREELNHRSQQKVVRC